MNKLVAACLVFLIVAATGVDPGPGAETAAAPGSNEEDLLPSPSGADLDHGKDLASRRVEAAHSSAEKKNWRPCDTLTFDCLDGGRAQCSNAGAAVHRARAADPPVSGDDSPPAVLVVPRCVVRCRPGFVPSAKLLLCEALAPGETAPFIDHFTLPSPEVHRRSTEDRLSVAAKCAALGCAPGKECFAIGPHCASLDVVATELSAQEPGSLVSRHACARLSRGCPAGDRGSCIPVSFDGADGATSDICSVLCAEDMVAIYDEERGFAGCEPFACQGYGDRR
jgi:hypothetical protein